MSSAVAVPVDSRQVPHGAPPVPWDALQDLAEGQLIGMLARGAGEVRVREDVAALRAALRGPATSVVEELLIDHIISSWLFLKYTERHQAATHASLGLTQGPGIALVESHDRRVERAARQHLDALRQLATVRRLLSGVPLFQWNQLNVAVNVERSEVR